MKAKISVYTRYIGYFVGFLLLVNQTYKGVIAIQSGTVILPDWGISLLTLTYGIFALACQMAAWWILMRSLDVEEVPLGNVFLGYTLSFLPRYIPGTIWGYMSRGNWLKEEYGIDYKKSTYGSLLELALMVIVNILIAGIIFLPLIGNPPIILLLSLFAFFLIIIILVHKRDIVKNHLENFKLKYLLFSSLFLFATWFFYGLGLFTLSEPANAFRLFDYGKVISYTGIYSSAWLIGFFIIFVPAGLGVREVALSYLLVLFLHISPPTANALSILFRLLTSLSEVSWLFLGWGVKRLSSS